MNDPFNAESPFNDQPDDPSLPPRMRGLVGHVPVLGVLMLVQGALELIMTLMMALFSALVINDIDRRQGLPNAPPTGVAVAVVIVAGIFLFICGALLIVAGIGVLRYRKRILAIVALGLSIASSLTCYCAPTAIGLLIYGLIVLLNQPVGHAFKMRENGASTEDIQNHFTG